MQLLLSPEACSKNNNNEAIIEDCTLKRCPATKTEDIIVLCFPYNQQPIVDDLRTKGAKNGCHNDWSVLP